MNLVPTTATRRERALPLLTLALAVVLITAFGFAFPGLGLVLAGALAFTVYRGDPAVRNALLVLGVAVTLLALAAAAGTRAAGAPKFELGEPVRVGR